MIKSGEKPCVEVTCDGCGEGDNDDYGGSYHYGTVDEALSAVEDRDWKVIRTRTSDLVRPDGEDGETIELYCFTCWDEMPETARAEKEANG